VTETGAETERIAELETENEQLRKALQSRIIIEQAKGMLIERLDLPEDAIFELLRSAARRSRMNLHELCAEVLRSRVTPEYIERQVAHLKPKRSPGAGAENS
jgi:AmiR/NasT family two-component response regulator